MHDARVWQLVDDWLCQLPEAHFVSVLPLGDNATLVLSPVRTIVFGALIVLFLIFEPHGLAEIWRRTRRFFHLWPFKT